MIPASEAKPFRALWAAVALGALLEHHKLIQRAKRRAHPDEITSEVDTARRYVESRDFRDVCGLAGLTIRPDDIMARLESGTMQFTQGAGR